MGQNLVAILLLLLLLLLLLFLKALEPKQNKN